MQYESAQLSDGKSITLREVGYDMARLWHKYYSKADVLLYVIDASNRAQLAMASVELYRVLENPSVSKPSNAKPLVILYNKIDQSQSMDIETLRQFLHVAELRACHGVRRRSGFDWPGYVRRASALVAVVPQCCCASAD